MRSVNRSWYRLRVPTLTPHLRAQHHRHRKICCKIISKKSQNFLKIRNCRNFAKMLVSKRILRKDSSSPQLRKDLSLCTEHVENTLNLEISQHPDREGGFVQIRRSAQSWTWNSVLTKDVIALISWSNPHCEWYQQIRYRNVRRNTHRERWIVQHRETCGKGWTQTEICCEFVYQCAHSWKKMDRHWSTTIVKIHDQNTATWILNSL